MLSPYTILYLLPKNVLSFWIGRLVLIRHPQFLARFALRVFVRIFGIAVEEAEKPFEQYDCIGDFFIRKLKPGIRPIDGTIVSPVDGVHRLSERIAAGSIIQAKGKSYSVASFLDDEQAAQKFLAGFFCNFYLSPRHYHRVHAPLSGQILGYRYVPGTLWPVNSWSINTIENLFCINERVITYMETELGSVALVMVGATNVGKMSLAFSDLLTNQKPLRPGTSLQVCFKEPICIEAGAPFGVFHMGSTVVVLFENPIDCRLNFEEEVCMGQNLV